jgi:hypothetical protein
MVVKPTRATNSTVELGLLGFSGIYAGTLTILIILAKTNRCVVTGYIASSVNVTKYNPAAHSDYKPCKSRC